MSLSVSHEECSDSLSAPQLADILVGISQAIFSRRDLNELLHLILTKSREITWSDAGSIYLVDRSDGVFKLAFVAAQNFSQPDLSLKEFAIPLTANSMAGYVAITGQSLNLADVYNLPANLPYKLYLTFDRDLAYHTRSMLVLPMQDHQGRILGILQLINRKKHPDLTLTHENFALVTLPYPDWQERVVRSLASQAAISIELNHLRQSFEHFQPIFPTNSFYIQGLISPQGVLLATNLPDGRSVLLPQTQTCWMISTTGEIATDKHAAEQWAGSVQYQAPDRFELVHFHEAQHLTFKVNGQTLRDRQILQDGDVIHFGDRVMTFYQPRST